MGVEQAAGSSGGGGEIRPAGGRSHRAGACGNRAGVSRWGVAGAASGEQRGAPPRDVPARSHAQACRRAGLNARPERPLRARGAKKLVVRGTTGRSGQLPPCSTTLKRHPPQRNPTKVGYPDGRQGAGAESLELRTLTPDAQTTRYKGPGAARALMHHASSLVRAFYTSALSFLISSMSGGTTWKRSPTIP